MFDNHFSVDPFGGALTRTSVRLRHALLTPDSYRVASAPPGWRGGAAVYLVITPALGSQFGQWHVELPSADASGEGDTGTREWVIYGLAGTAELRFAAGTAAAGGPGPETVLPLVPGAFAYLPPGTRYALRGGSGEASSGPARLLVFEKTYQPLAGRDAPAARTGHESDVPGKPFLGDPDARLQVLLPEEPEFDFAVNVFRFSPGATLPFVESHVMEHGLLVLAGGGVYRLEDCWYPVRAGDAIWMAPYCPQWFIAGRHGASYLYCKDVNRLP